MNIKVLIMSSLLIGAITLNADDTFEPSKRIYSDSKSLYFQIKNDLMQSYQQDVEDLKKKYRQLEQDYKRRYRELTPLERQKHQDLIYETRDSLDHLALSEKNKLSTVSLKELQRLETNVIKRKNDLEDYLLEQREAYLISRGQHLNQSFGMHEPSGDVLKLSELGLGWVRLSYRMGEATHLNFEKYLDAGIRIFLTLNHRDHANLLMRDGVLPINQTERGSYPPQDTKRYQDLIHKTIKPMVDYCNENDKTLSEWLVIQFGNEIQPLDLYPGREDTPKRFWHGIADDYLKTLELTYTTIKSIDSNIPVALGGLSSGSLENTLKANPNELETISLNWLSRQLTEGQFDIIDIHLYHRVQDINTKINWIKKISSKRLIVSETGGPDEAVDKIVYSQERQAHELPERLSTILNNNVEIVFCTKLYDTNESSEQRFRNLSFHDSAGIEKPVFDTYKQFIESHRK